MNRWNKIQTCDKIEDMRSKVDHNKIYSATDIQRLGLFPWAKGNRGIVKILESGILETEISGENQQKRYSVKGSEIIKYINQYGHVLIHTARKQYDRSKTKRSSKTKAR